MSDRKPLPDHAKMVFKGVLYEVWQWEQTMFDGSTQTFEAIKGNDSAAVIATVDGNILLEHMEQPQSDPYLAVPGGRLDEGEDGLAAAKRELLEETGYASDDWEALERNYSGGRIITSREIFVARNCRKVADPTPDAGERISVSFISFEEFLLLPERPDFRVREMNDLIYIARLHPEKMSELKRKIFGA